MERNIKGQFTSNGSLSEKNLNWKGDLVGNNGLHMWVKYHKGKPVKCENVDCKYPRKNSHGVMMLQPKRFEWANISRMYKRELNDWISLCPSCHRQYDFTEEMRSIQSKSHFGMESKKKKMVFQFDINKNLVKLFDSLTEASRITNVSIGDISNVMNGKRRTAGGYIWI